jgi:hypothetical protein
MPLFGKKKQAVVVPHPQGAEVADHGRQGTVYASLEEFFAQRPERRDSPQVEFGIMWREGTRKQPRYRVAWLEATGELYSLGLSEHEPLCKVELLGQVRNRETLEMALSGWEALPYAETTLEWVRTQISMKTPGGGAIEPTAKPPAPAAPAPAGFRRTA